MWSSIELRDIRTFLTLAEELHYGRTAERLGLTPSRVSQTIRTLEQRVGVKLFDRTSRRVRLTSLGEQLRDGILPAYEQLQRAYLEVHEAATGIAGPLRIGMYARSNGGPHLADIVRRFHDRYPACRVQLIETNLERDQLDWLCNDDTDLLAMRLPFTHPDVVVGPTLSREERVVIVARDHPLASKDAISYEDLAPYVIPDGGLPRETLDAFIPPRTPSGRRLRRIVVHSLGEAVMRVAIGELVHPTVRSFLDYYPHPDIVQIPIIDLPPSETALLWLRANHSAKVAAFAQLAAEILQSMASAKAGIRATA
jgi:DNA-binding transcriptional LysR family regulator